MKNSLSSALLILSSVGFIIMPAKAVDDFLTIDQTQIEESTTGQWCVWFPWVGGLCWDL